MRSEEDTSGAERSADYMISESGKQTPTSKGKRGFGSVTDKIKEKVTGTAKSIKEGTTGTGDDDDKAGNLDSAQTRQGKIGDAAADPKTTGPTDNLREKAAKTIDEGEDSEEPA